jgi:hypothetical protein
MIMAEILHEKNAKLPVAVIFKYLTIQGQFQTGGQFYFPAIYFVQSRSGQVHHGFGILLKVKKSFVL